MKFNHQRQVFMWTSNNKKKPSNSSSKGARLKFVVCAMYNIGQTNNDKRVYRNITLNKVDI